MKWKVKGARSKMGNRKVKFDGYTFDSQLECARYKELKLLLAAKEIRNLQVHPSFMIHINGIEICRVELDFEYYVIASDLWTVEDTKGHDTDMSKLKRKMVEADYGVKVKILTKKDVRV